MRDPTMLDDVYNAKILELAAHIGRTGRLAVPDATARAQSRLCGSTITVDLTMSGGVITDFAHEVRACALGQASSSVMAREVIGSTVEELRSVHSTMHRMLKENGPPPEGRWSDLRYLQPVREHKSRHASTLLTFDAVLAAISQIEAEGQKASTP